MKYVLFIIDGLSDVPSEDLAGRTPLEGAFAPALNALATWGKVGRLTTTFPGLPIESMVCVMGLLGYDPVQYYPGGRSAFEAMAKGIPLHDGDLIFRCNTVSVTPGPGTLTDFTAGMISDADARRAISRMKVPDPTWELYPGQSYRNTLIIRNAGVHPDWVECSPPHQNIGGSVRDLLPRAKHPAAKPLVDRLGEFLLDSHAQMTADPAHEAANMLWLWSPSHATRWPRFESLTGLRAGVVGGLDFLHGIALASEIHYDVIPGATGYLDTNYAAKLDYSIRYVERFDLTIVHVNAADEAAHMRSPRLKRDVIETIDQSLLEPLIGHLQRHHRDDFRILVCGDHMTRSDDGRHDSPPVPYVVFGAGIEPSRDSYSETFAQTKPVEPALTCLDLLIGTTRPQNP